MLMNIGWRARALLSLLLNCACRRVRLVIIVNLNDLVLISHQADIGQILVLSLQDLVYHILLDRRKR